MNGAYGLVIALRNSQEMSIGSARILFFKKGYYFYAGSAMNGIENRVNYHLTTNKKFHWHIDYFLEKASIIEVYVKENTIREECTIAQMFHGTLEPIAGFGCTDCRCASHLFYGPLHTIHSTIQRAHMSRYLP
jgi:Uri superfamily endonuclease